MFEKVELDAVSICTPNKFHAPATIAALKAGCHVLCEKPPAMTAVKALEMEAAAQSSGKILTYGFCNRYRARAQYFKRSIEAGELGHIHAGRAAAMRRNGIPGGVFVRKRPGLRISSLVRLLVRSIHTKYETAGLIVVRPNRLWSVNFQVFASKMRWRPKAGITQAHLLDKLWGSGVRSWNMSERRAHYSYKEIADFMRK